MGLLGKAGRVHEVWLKKSRKGFGKAIREKRCEGRSQIATYQSCEMRYD